MIIKDDLKSSQAVARVIPVVVVTGVVQEAGEVVVDSLSPTRCRAKVSFGKTN